MFKRLVNSAIVFGMLALAPPAHAQSSCAQRDNLITRLGERFEEAPAAGGLITETRILEIWAAPETGTWTALMTDAKGRSCVLATGTNWHQSRPTLPIQDEAS